MKCLLRYLYSKKRSLSWKIPRCTPVIIIIIIQCLTSWDLSFNIYTLQSILLLEERNHELHLSPSQHLLAQRQQRKPWKNVCNRPKRGHSQRLFIVNFKQISQIVLVLVKTEFDCTDRSVETRLGRCMLVVTGISVDAYPFLAFSDLNCHLEDTGIGVFWLHCAWVSFVTTDEFSVMVTKITSRIGISWTHSLPFHFLTYFDLFSTYFNIIKRI